MATDRRTGWLADLQVGDEVGIVSSTGHHAAIVRVVSISPSGQIWAGGKRYMASGRAHGAGRWSYPYLAPPTPEVRERARACDAERRAARLVDRLSRVAIHRRVSAAAIEEACDLIERAHRLLTEVPDVD